MKEIAQQKTSPRLWELSQEIEQLENAIAAIQDDTTLADDERETNLEKIFSQWLEAGDNFDSKAEKVAGYIRHQESLAEARKAEYRRLRELAEQAENQAERLRKYLTNEMVKANKKSVKGITANISLRKKPPRVIVNCEPSELPPEFVKVEYTPKLAKIKELLKADQSLDWAYLSDSQEYSVTIR
jgi:DNA repair exonuclease SbcCD ATPase subunit